MIHELFTWQISNILIYLLGGAVEVLGIVLVTNKNLIRPGFIKRNHIWIGIILAFIGYIIAVSARGGN